jgi:hypothetical protein
VKPKDETKFRVSSWLKGEDPRLYGMMEALHIKEDDE